MKDSFSCIFIVSHLTRKRRLREKSRMARVVREGDGVRGVAPRVCSGIGVRWRKIVTHQSRGSRGLRGQGDQEEGGQKEGDSRAHTYTNSHVYTYANVGGETVFVYVRARRSRGKRLKYVDMRRPQETSPSLPFLPLTGSLPTISRTFQMSQSWPEFSFEFPLIMILETNTKTFLLFNTLLMLNLSFLDRDI